MLTPRQPQPAPASGDVVAPAVPSPPPATPSPLGPARKCTTPQCPASPAEPFEVQGDERIEFSFGRAPTVAWACACGQVRKTLKVPPAHVPAPE
jgi:hypothetical protein